MPRDNQYYSTNAYAAEVARLMAVRHDRIDTYRRLLSSQTPGIESVYNSQYRRSMNEGIWEQWSQPMSTNEVPLINDQLRSEYKDLIQQNGVPADWDQWIKKVNEPCSDQIRSYGWRLMPGYLIAPQGISVYQELRRQLDQGISLGNIGNTYHTIYALEHGGHLVDALTYAMQMQQYGHITTPDKCIEESESNHHMGVCKFGGCIICENAQPKPERIITKFQVMSGE